MAIETEAKFKVGDLEPVRRQLRRLGAALIGEFDETNVFFDTPDGRLLGHDSGLRLRTSRDRLTGQSVHRLTWKGPRRPGRLKQREEIEVSVDDAAACTLLLQRLNFKPGLHFEKTRQSWRLDDCRVELDSLPGLGLFVEIEGPSEAAVLAARDRLQLQHLPLIRESYPALLSAHPRPA